MFFEIIFSSVNKKFEAKMGQIFLENAKNT